MPYGSAGPSPLGDDDAGSGTDAGDHESDALPIAPGAYNGRLSPVIDPTDWYSFNVTAGQGITARAGSSLYTPGMYLVGPERGYRVSTSRDTNVLAAETGTWYLVVESYLFGNLASEYGFSIQVVDLPAQDDAGSGRDASYEDPVALPDGISNGTLNKYDTRDTFVFDVTGTELIQVTITTDISDFKIASLREEDCCDGDSTGGSASEMYLEYTFTDTTVMLTLQVYPFFSDINGGDYQIELVRAPIEEIALPDLVITDLVEHRRPITTDFGEVPNNVNERRLIEVEVTNVGATDVEDARIGVEFRQGHDPDPHRYGGYYSRSTRWVDVAAGESVRITVAWDTTTRIGDHTIVATADAYDSITEADEENNGAHIYTYVRVGGVV